VSVETLGHILRQQGNSECVQHYEEAIHWVQRIKDPAAEATIHFNLGHAYKDIPAIRNLDSAEAAYQRSRALFDPNDALAHALAIKQIGMVQHERFNESRQRNEPAETVVKHSQAAGDHYHQALVLCPPTALTELGPIHNELGSLYDALGQTEAAREHYEKATQYFEQTRDRYHAGAVHYNIALMYLQAAGRDATPSRQRDLLHRAQAYAKAALRDFQHYQNRAAHQEADTQQLLTRITQALTKLP
jgi:tetratricopeptide (TPR) repeat protein